MFLGLTRLWVVVIVIVITQISLAYCIHIHSSDPIVPHNYFQVALGTADNALWAWLLVHWALLSKAMEPSGPMLVHGERGGEDCAFSLPSGTLWAVLLLPQVLQSFKSNCLFWFHFQLFCSSWNSDINLTEPGLEDRCEWQTLSYSLKCSSVPRLVLFC